MFSKRLRGISITFSDGMETLPLPQIKPRYESREKIIQVNVDPSKRISKISFGLSLCDSIAAIRCYDEKGEQFVEQNWWERKAIESNKEEQ